MDGEGQFSFRFQKEIQGLRGIAVLLVVLYHANLIFTGGFIGVDVFFVISGYVITGNILHQVAQDKFRWWNFVERRVRRLLPSLSVMLVGTLLIGVFLNPISTMEFARRTGAAAILVNANHYLLRQGGYFDGAAELNPFLHTWSLSVEEQFYIAFPIIVILSIGAGFKLKRLAWVLCALITISSGLSLFLSYTPEIFGHSGPKLAFFLAATRSWEFGIGALLALAPKKLYSSNLAWIGLVGVITSAAFIGPGQVFPGVIVFLPVIAAALLIAGSRNQDSIISKSLSHTYLVRIGDVSYGWYLWHWPFMVFAKGLNPSISSHLLGAIGVFTLGLAFLNEKWVEKPIRHSPRIRLLDWRLIAAVSFCAPLLMFGAVKTIQLNSSLPQYAAARKMEQEYDAIGCDEIKSEFDLDKCRWGNGPRVLLLGDSNARQHIPALREVTGFEFTARTMSGCPLSRSLVRDGVSQRHCWDWTEQIRDFVEEYKPDVIIISVAFGLYAEHPLFSFEHMEQGSKLEHMIEELETFGLLGAKLHLVGEIDKYRRGGDYVTLFDCSPIGIEFDQEERCVEWTDEVGPIESDRITTLPRPQDIQRGPNPRYFRDGGHLNPNGSRQLTSFWNDLLK